MIWYGEVWYGWTLGSNIPKELADGPASSPTLLASCKSEHLINCTIAFTFYTPVYVCDTAAMGCVSRWLASICHTALYGQAAPAGDCERSKQWPVKACKQRHPLLMLQKQKENLPLKN